MTDFRDLNLIYYTDVEGAEEGFQGVFDSYAESNLNPNTSTFSGGSRANASNLVVYTDKNEFIAATGQKQVGSGRFEAFTSKYNSDHPNSISIYIAPRKFEGSNVSRNDAILHELVHVAVTARSEFSGSNPIHSPDFYIKLQQVVTTTGIETSGWSSFDPRFAEQFFSRPFKLGGKEYFGTQLEISIYMTLDGTYPPLTNNDIIALAGAVGEENLVLIFARMGRLNGGSSELDSLKQKVTSLTGIELKNECFGPEVMIDMWPVGVEFTPDPRDPLKLFDQDAVRAKVWQKPISQIRVGDWVVSSDKSEKLVPGFVPRVMTNKVKIVLNFFGTCVTPGHVYYREDSKDPNKFETLIDILREDGVIKRQDGTLIRAATGIPISDPRDGFVKAITGTHNADGNIQLRDSGRIRLGTRFIVSDGNDHKSFSVADLISAGGGVVGDDELVIVENKLPMPFHWVFSNTLPMPEDFVLACSGTTIDKIFMAAEWESQSPRLSAPMPLNGGSRRLLNASRHFTKLQNAPLNVDGNFSNLEENLDGRFLDRGKS